jgi:hypothetical protein
MTEDRDFTAAQNAATAEPLYRVYIRRTADDREMPFNIRSLAASVRMAALTAALVSRCTPAPFYVALYGDDASPEAIYRDGAELSTEDALAALDTPFDDYASCPPMFAAIERGKAWLDAQDAGLTTWTVHTPYDAAFEIAGIFLDEDTALRIAGDRPVCRASAMCGTYIQ